MRLFFCCLLTIFLSACGSSEGTEADVDSFNRVKFNEDLPTDFMQFYMQFHVDSLYQMEHILFPLDGVPPNADKSEVSNFKWTKEGWLMHKPFNNPDDSFSQEYLSVDDNTVIEYIVDTQAGFGMERRFSKLSGDWYLIHYAAMNQIVENE